MQIALMPNKSTSGGNNRANEANQSSRHHHTKGAGSSYPDEKEIQRQQPEQLHEYYPDFDQTGRGVNPDSRVKRESE